jgi:SAM-dependent methyltransferase
MTVESPNPLARFAHRTRMARSLSIVKRYLPYKGSLVDFGAGTGLLLHQIRQQYPAAELFGVEPFMDPLYPTSARYVRALTQLPQRSVDVICAFEVCEHMHESEIREFLLDSSRTLRPTGRLIVSVPIMYGALVAPKVLNHIRLGGWTHYSLRHVVRSTLGLSVPRPSDPRTTHMGFDFRWLKHLIAERFRIETSFYSPFTPLPWFFNSQIFMVCSVLRQV